MVIRTAVLYEFRRQIHFRIIQFGLDGYWHNLNTLIWLITINFCLSLIEKLYEGIEGSNYV